jgi:D-alanine-D-alanine ligase
LLDAAGFAYAGCDAPVSALCIDKLATKQRVAAVGVPVLPDCEFVAGAAPCGDVLRDMLGSRVILKPNASGSSVGLHILAETDDWDAALAQLGAGRWLAEPHFAGADHTVGWLAGQALAVVAIQPASGVYDYSSKYTAGLTRYQCPAPLPAPLTQALQRDTVRAAAACGVRDFARIDWLVDAAGRHVFLEINTIPGMTATSLLPMSAAACGHDFGQLVWRMVEPAVGRWRVLRSGKAEV